MHWIQPLSEITLADIDRVGSKAAHLGAMLRAGFPVPPGFVIDTNAFVAHFSEITDPLVKPPVPRLQAELMADVVQALIEHLGNEQELAVRSSGTDEDSSHASFAGQHSTYYFVPPNRIDQAIVDCWMSLWSNAAVAYRRAGWAEISSGEPVRMAVIVQQMLPATRSGVVFSRDPIDAKNNDTVIEASWGLGAALVDGRVSPDHIRASEDGEILSYAVNDKQFQVSAAASNRNAQRLQEVPAQLRQKAVLEPEEIAQITNIAAQLETLFEAPQDIEWAFVDGELYLLQARPITTRPRVHGISEKLVLFKPLAENFTEPLTPLTEDLFAQVLPPIGAFYEGRCYLNLDHIRRLNVFKLDEHQLVNLALLRQMPDQLPLSGAKALGAVLMLAMVFLADGANWIRTAWASPEALARFPKLLNKLRHTPTLSPAQTLHRLVWGKHPFEPIGLHMFYTNVSAGRYFLYIGLLNALVKRFAPEYPLDQLSRTYHGDEDMRSLALLRELDHLTDLLRQARERNDENSKIIEDVIAGQATALPNHIPFTEAFEQFLHTYGHRGPREMELAAPSWREAPGTLLSLLSSAAANSKISSETHGNHLAARDVLNRHLKPWQQRLVNRIRKKISTFIALRENTRHYHIMVFDLVRQKILEQERTLLHHNLLKVAGDIFFLRTAEIDALLNKQLSGTQAHERVRQRRREWHRQARMPVPETINVDIPEPWHASAEGALKGQCACPGVVEAKARVIHSLSEANQLAQGEILVAPYTDPAWTPLFSRAAGIIVETGSFLSHAGTVARELHVPCVVDVKTCMQQIPNGATVRMDASAGTVELVMP